jgi:NAD-dependent deacetylase
MEQLQKARNFIEESSNIVAFTGAGASTESNIPDFRSNGGLYNSNGRKYEYPPEYMLSHTFFMEHTDLFYDYYKSNMIYKDAKPNECHLSLAKLEREGKLKAVVTQNIDGLHQAAGSQTVFELHGSVQRNICMKCKKKFDLDYIIGSDKAVPRCNECGGIIKPDVVLYEEMLDQDVLHNAISAISRADVLLVIGTSLVVYPAAGLIDYYSGKKMILINKTQTPYDGRADIVINQSAGETLKSLVE